MTMREKFLAYLHEGKSVSALAFSGSIPFTKTDIAWLRRQVASGKIIETKDYAFPNPVSVFSIAD